MASGAFFAPVPKHPESGSDRRFWQCFVGNLEVPDLCALDLVGRSEMLASSSSGGKQGALERSKSERNKTYEKPVCSSRLHGFNGLRSNRRPGGGRCQ